jgi:hypothetical protein
MIFCSFKVIIASIPFSSRVGLMGTLAVFLLLLTPTVQAEDPLTGTTVDSPSADVVIHATEPELPSGDASTATNGLAQQQEQARRRWLAKHPHKIAIKVKPHPVMDSVPSSLHNKSAVLSNTKPLAKTTTAAMLHPLLNKPSATVQISGVKPSVSKTISVLPENPAPPIPTVASHQLLLLTEPLSSKWMRPFASPVALSGVTLGYPLPFRGRYAKRAGKSALVPTFAQQGHTKLLTIKALAKPALSITQPVVTPPLKRLAEALKTSSPEHTSVNTPPVLPAKQNQLTQPMASTAVALSHQSIPNTTTQSVILPAEEGQQGIPLNQIAQHQASNRPVTAGTLIRMLGGLLLVISLLAFSFKMRWFGLFGKKPDTDFVAARQASNTALNERYQADKQAYRNHLLQRLQLPAHPDNKLLELIGSRALDEDRTVHLLQVKDRYLLLGTGASDGPIQVLSQFTDMSTEPNLTEASVLRPEESNHTAAIIAAAQQVPLAPTGKAADDEVLESTDMATVMAAPIEAWHDEAKTKPVTVIEEEPLSASVTASARKIYEGELHPFVKDVDLVNADVTQSQSLDGNHRPFADLAKRYAALASSSVVNLTGASRSLTTTTPNNEPNNSNDDRALAATRSVSGVTVLDDYED